jgi:hypothetical protein
MFILPSDRPQNVGGFGSPLLGTGGKSAGKCPPLEMRVGVAADIEDRFHPGSRAPPVGKRPSSIEFCTLLVPIPRDAISHARARMRKSECFTQDNTPLPPLARICVARFDRTGVEVSSRESPLHQPPDQRFPAPGRSGSLIYPCLPHLNIDGQNPHYNFYHIPAGDSVAQSTD